MKRITFVLCAALVAACSGEEQGSPAEEPNKAEEKTEPGPAANVPLSDVEGVPPPGTPAPGDAGAPDSAVATDASVPPAPSGSCFGGAGATLEVEANDSPGTATLFTSAGCGTVAGAGDVDHFAFVLAATATSYSAGFSASALGIDAKILVRGVEYPFSGGAPWAPGERYVVIVRSTAADPVDYRITVTQ